MSVSVNCKIRDRFPLTAPRDQQVQIMDWLDENWDSKRFFMIDAPPGVGKSAIAMAAARTAARAYFLTSTKILQDQYMESFSDVKNLKGKDNYDCGINPIFRVSAAPCVSDRPLKNSCVSQRICPYYNAVSDAMRADFMITSYAYFLMAVECGPLKDREPEYVRGLVVCDEAHEIDSIMASFVGFELDPKLLREEFGISASSPIGSISAAKDEQSRRAAMKTFVDEFVSPKLEEFEEAVKSVMDAAKRAANNNIGKIHPNAAKQAREITQKRDRLDRIYKRVQRYYQGRAGSAGDWLMTKEDGKLVFSPLTGRVGFQEYISSFADKVIMMSASLGDPDVLADELGIDKREMCSISVGTPFDPARSPVYVCPVAKMDKNNIAASMPIIVEAIGGIMDSHPDEKGIVHTGNYRIAEAIIDGLSKSTGSRVIGKKNSRIRESNEELLLRHVTDEKPTVLVSPSMHTGVDLRDELSRFQVVAKLPWSNLGDPRVAEKAKNPKWYANDMIKKLVQASGRSTRSEEDHAVTYILDSGFTNVWNRWHSLIPSWFRERVSLVE